MAFEMGGIWNIYLGSGEQIPPSEMFINFSLP